MSRTSEFVLLVALFILRLGVPLALTCGVCMFLRALDRKWEREAEQVSGQTGEAPDATSSTAPSAIPCWVFRNCPETRKSTCAACKDTSLPCWLARMRAEGRLPSTCAGCARYRPTGDSFAAAD